MSYPPQPPQQPPQVPQQPQQYPPQYQQGQYQQPYGQYQAPVAPKNNTLAMVGFWIAIAMIPLIWFLSWFGWILNLAAFILCIIGNSQIKASNGAQTGKGFAVAGIVITCVLFGLIVLFTIAVIALGVSILGGIGGLQNLAP